MLEDGKGLTKLWTERQTFILILKSYFGYDSFLPLQEEIMANVLDGRDTLAHMPTGAGMNPSAINFLLLSFRASRLVVSPLIALMKDRR